MSDDDKKPERKKSWLWTALSVLALGVGSVVLLFILIGFSMVILKWGLIALLIYGAFVLARRLLGKSEDADASETALLPEANSQPDSLALLEQDHELDKLKARMTDPSE